MLGIYRQLFLERVYSLVETTRTSQGGTEVVSGPLVVGLPLDLPTENLDSFLETLALQKQACSQHFQIGIQAVARHETSYPVSKLPRRRSIGGEKSTRAEQARAVEAMSSRLRPFPISRPGHETLADGAIEGIDFGRIGEQICQFLEVS